MVPIYGNDMDCSNDNLHLKQAGMTKQELGAEIARMRKAHGITNYRTFKNYKVPEQTIKAVLRGETAYTVDTLYSLLKEVGKTLTIVDL